MLDNCWGYLRVKHFADLSMMSSVFLKISTVFCLCKLQNMDQLFKKNKILGWAESSVLCTCYTDHYTSINE